MQGICHFRAECRSFSRVRRSRQGRSSRNTWPCTGGIHGGSPDQLAEQEELVEGVTVVSGMRSADQSRGDSGSSVGRRSSVSSSSARWASLASDHPSARAIRSATSHVGFAVPRSIPRIVLSSTFAASASASWVSPLSRRRKPIARPRAACGVRLGRTPEDSAWTARMNRNYVSGYDMASMAGYSISRSRSAGVVRSARASRSRVRVVASACAFSSSLRNDKSTPLRWATLTCESPTASRDARRLRAS
jgi:hypothetical protein